MSERYHVELLAKMPLDEEIGKHMDIGMPPLVLDATTQTAHRYSDIARKIAVKIAKLAKDTSLKFPKIVVETPK